MDIERRDRIVNGTKHTLSWGGHAPLCHTQTKYLQYIFFPCSRAFSPHTQNAHERKQIEFAAHELFNNFTLIMCNWANGTHRCLPTTRTYEHSVDAWIGVINQTNASGYIMLAIIHPTRCISAATLQSTHVVGWLDWSTGISSAHNVQCALELVMTDARSS